MPGRASRTRLVRPTRRLAPRQSSASTSPRSSAARSPCAKVIRVILVAQYGRPGIRTTSVRSPIAVGAWPSSSTNTRAETDSADADKPMVAAAIRTNPSADSAAVETEVPRRFVEARWFINFPPCVDEPEPMFASKDGHLVNGLFLRLASAQVPIPVGLAARTSLS
jgi:hypothetical protein